MIPPLHLLTMACVLGAMTARAAEPQVFRTFMPEAGPSAFGVVLGPELALCYDGLRGGVNQVWRGSLDLAPTLQAKINQPAKVLGVVFYAEKMFQPLRVNDPSRVPARRFKGYRLEKQSIAYDYTLDGVKVRETLRALDDGLGLERVWSVQEGATLFFHAEPQPDARVSFHGAEEIKPGVWRHVGGVGKCFTMRIQLKSKS